MADDANQLSDGGSGLAPLRGAMGFAIRNRGWSLRDEPRLMAVIPAGMKAPGWIE